MIKFDKETLLKVAKLSALKLTEGEIPKISNDLNKLLEYVDELNNVKVLKENTAIRNKNIFRNDEIITQDPSALLNQAPKTKDNYFVVPPMLDKSSSESQDQDK